MTSVSSVKVLKAFYVNKYGEIKAENEIEPQLIARGVTKLFNIDSNKLFYRKIYIAWDNIERANKPNNFSPKTQYLNTNSKNLLAASGGERRPKRPSSAKRPSASAANRSKSIDSNTFCSCFILC